MKVYLKEGHICWVRGIITKKSLFLQEFTGFTLGRWKIESVVQTVSQRLRIQTHKTHNKYLHQMKATLYTNPLMNVPYDLQGMHQKGVRGLECTVNLSSYLQHWIWRTRRTDRCKLWSQCSLVSRGGSSDQWQQPTAETNTMMLNNCLSSSVVRGTQCPQQQGQI